jgi:hypothetical protein
MIISPSKSINKAYKQVTIERSSFNNFCSCLGKLFDDINDSQTEETQKTHLQAFFAKTFYENYYMAPEGDIDLTIHLDKTENSHVGLIIEVKNTTNKNEMVSCNDLNKKALQELLLYYLRQRLTRNNTDLKYLVATNIFEYFIFDAQTFEKFFFNNGKLKKEFIDFENGAKSGTKTDFFYKEIASKYIAEVAKDLDYTYFNLLDYKNLLNKNSVPEADDLSCKKLVELYRVFSDTHLLKLSFQNDSNSLNKNFYSELLYILGLEEKKVDNKNVIVRKEEGKRNDSSLIENAINILDSEDRLESLNHINIYGETKSEQLFTVAMELCITWINRILFLKLLEAQLLKYHKGDERYKFLTIKKIGDFDELNKLFFQVLARNYSDRKQDVREKYKYIPYLNSSLFEMNELEHNTISINSLSQANLPVIATSVLKNRKNENAPKSLPILEYIFDFLDAYNFSSEGSDEVQDEAKTLINASVLGLIFEKINGQKDGSVFTPGFITMFMSKESIERVVLQKFNEKYGWKCDKLTDLYNNIKVDDTKAANEIINNLKICDPAVGSGHYLVSVLNELIRIKYELGILIDDSGKRIKQQDYIFSIENDELIVTDEEGELFKYIPGNPESQRIQELLFREKRQIIENCLFGVDINQNAVNICRLRLWIELLKNAYYTKESNYTLLETLPNIDINIKCGNSLLHRFDLKDSIQSILKEANISIKEYKEAVEKYKATSVKESKKEFLEIIKKIKSTLKTELNKKDKTYVSLLKKKKEISTLEDPEFEGEGFKLSKTQLNKKNKDISRLKKDINTLEEQIEDIKSNKIYLGAFEWRFEFPEVLDDEGNFMGFDCVIGNPPYMQLQSIISDSDALSKMSYCTYTRTGDVYCIFYELALQLLNSNGILCFITSNKWMRAAYGATLRSFLASKSNPLLLIDFSGVKVFETATVDNNILLLSNEQNHGDTVTCAIKDKSCLNKLSNYIEHNGTHMSLLQQNNKQETSGSWVLLSNIEQIIKQKIEQAGVPLKNWNVSIFRGIITGLNDAYILDQKQRSSILLRCTSEEERIRTAELIRPILRGRDIKKYRYDYKDLYVILAYFGSYKILPIKYPTVFTYLSQFKSALEARGQCRYTSSGKVNINHDYLGQHHWLELDNNPSLLKLEDFNTHRIIYNDIAQKLTFALADPGVFINNTAYYIKGEMNTLKYLIAFLNSSIIDWYYRSISVQLGANAVRMFSIYMKNLPVPKATEKTKTQLLKLVDKILTLKHTSNENIDLLQKDIDKILMEIYNLTEDEMRIITHC